MYFKNIPDRIIMKSRLFRSVLSFRLIILETRLLLNFFRFKKKKNNPNLFCLFIYSGLELQVVQNKRAAHSCWSPPPSGRRRGQSEERCWSVRGLGSVDLQPRMCSCLPSARCQRCSHHLPLTEAPLRAPRRLCSQRSARLTPTAKQHRAHSDGWIYKLEASQFF